jgi:four helix bundle protein
MRLEDLEVYQLSMALGEKIWSSVDEWKYFEKDAIGKQLVKAADSIAANISEGFGRFHYKEAKQFNYYARGSLFETKTWLNKAYQRKLVSEAIFKQLLKDLDIIGVKLNNYIKSIGRSNKQNK